MSQQEDYSSFFGRDDKPIESEPELEAYRERIIASERTAGGIRGLIVILNAIAYFLLVQTGFFQPEQIEHHPLLAYIVLGLSFLHGAYIYLSRPGEQYPVMFVSYFGYVADIVFITLWLYATGGYGSPFFVLWYASIVLTAFRFNWRIVWATSLIYVVSYVSLVLVLSQVHTSAQITELLLRCAYIVGSGFIASLISRETLVQTREKLEMKNMARSLLLTQRELEENKEQLEELTRLLEARVTERTKDLDVSTRNFSMLLDSIHLITWTTNSGGKVNYFNKAWERFFRGTIDGNNLSDFVHPEDLPGMKQKWLGVLENGQEADGEFRWKRHDGEWRRMLVNIICLRNDHNQIVMWIGTATDITG